MNKLLKISSLCYLKIISYYSVLRSNISLSVISAISAISDFLDFLVLLTLTTFTTIDKLKKI
jgi:hypothetical protein